jgi:hypothetical protein
VLDRDRRELERALAATPGDAGLRVRLAEEHLRGGRADEACRVLGVRLETRFARPLAWGEVPLSNDEVLALARDDLAALDPLRLFEAFPRRRDGLPRGNTTRFLARYKAHTAGAPSQRLVLCAWTRGTGNRFGDPNEITIALDLRSTWALANVLPASAWRRDARGLTPLPS